MKYKKYYFATGNKQKLERIQNIFQEIGSDIIFEKIPELIDVAEDKDSAVGNALQKLEPYTGKYDVPVLAGDVAIFFEGIDFDPTHAKRKTLTEAGLDEGSLSQEEIYETMLHYYRDLARKKGGEFDFYYEDGWAVLYPDGSTKTFSYKRELIMTDHVEGEPQFYFPMCNLYKGKKTGKYYMNWTREEFREEFSEMYKVLKKELIGTAH